MAKQLTKAQCMLLAVDLASESNTKALHTLVPLRPDALEPELVLRILLTYLPESVPPADYTKFVDELVSHLWLEQQEAITIDISSVNTLTDSTAQSRVDKLHLPELKPPSFPPRAPSDALTGFLCHRAWRIDAETGLVTLLPDLFKPFLDQNDYIRTWFISVVLPVLRLAYEYYPSIKSSISLTDFEDVDGRQGIEMLLANATHTTHEITSPTDSEGTIARDLRGLVGPWMYGNTIRRTRKAARRPKAESRLSERRISLTGISAEDKTDHDWEYAYKWLVHRAVSDFPMVTNAIEDWSGPSDVDLGAYGDEHHYLDEELQMKLEKRYAQSAFAACYAVQANTDDAIDGAHGILVRLAAILDFEPPPDLATSVEQLPKVDKQAAILHESTATILLEPDVLMDASHPLTSPTLPTFMLLQMLVYSAYQLAGLGQPISIVNVTKLRFYSNEDEQLDLLHKVLHGLRNLGKRDEQQWLTDRGRLLWLWNWNIDPEEGALKGAGPMGSIERDALEKEILRAMIATGSELVPPNSDQAQS